MCAKFYVYPPGAHIVEVFSLQDKDKEKNW